MDVIRRYKENPPVDVRAAILELNIEYREMPMPADQSGYFARLGGRFIIGVNSNDGYQRRRFTAAHELGHYVLHRDLLREGEHFDRLYGAAARHNPPGPFSPLHEVQANQFAADFLMPSALTARAYRESADPSQVANRFGVSLAAAEIRLKNLGLVR